MRCCWRISKPGPEPGRLARRTVPNIKPDPPSAVKGENKVISGQVVPLEEIILTVPEELTGLGETDGSKLREHQNPARRAGRMPAPPNPPRAARALHESFVQPLILTR